MAAACSEQPTRLRKDLRAFDLGEWVFELFGDVYPADQQSGWCHFDGERRLLRLDDGWLRAALVRLRANGQKTEPPRSGWTAILTRRCGDWRWRPIVHYALGSEEWGRRCRLKATLHETSPLARRCGLAVSMIGPDLLWSKYKGRDTFRGNEAARSDRSGRRGDRGRPGRRGGAHVDATALRPAPRAPSGGERSRRHSLDH
jgi:Domain of unknown function (DUF4269)